MDGPPPGVDLSSLTVKPNIITSQQKQPQLPKINRNDRLGDDDPLPPLDKCDACFVLWRSMEGVLEAEPKMDKDRTDVPAARLSRGADGDEAQLRDVEVRAARLVERVCELVNAFRYNAQGAYWVRDKALVAAFEAGKKPLAKPGHGRLPTDELRVSLVNYCSTTVEDHEDELTQLLLDGGIDDGGPRGVLFRNAQGLRGDAAGGNGEDILWHCIAAIIASSRHRITPTTDPPAVVRRRSDVGKLCRPRLQIVRARGGALPTANHMALCPVVPSKRQAEWHCWRLL